MKPEVNLGSMRARKARIRLKLNAAVRTMLAVSGIALLLCGLYSWYFDDLVRIGYFAASAAIICFIILLWYAYELKNLAPSTRLSTLDDILEPGLLATLTPGLTPQKVWHIALKHPEAKFISHHLLMTSDIVSPMLSDKETDMEIIWQQAAALAGHAQLSEIHCGILATALLVTSEQALQFLKTEDKLGTDDVLEVLSWLERQLAYIHMPKPNYGGIGRDWATGFTPTLERFSQNMSFTVQAHGGFAHYYSHSELLDGIVSSLERGSSVALIGPDGAGKTTLVYGLAQRLLEGNDPQLAYYQVVSLNASVILSSASEHLEDLMLTLFGEATMAGNIILFLDDAQLFFSQGTGTFDMSQILLPVLKNRNLKLIAAFDSPAWQQLQASRQALTSSFTPVTLREPDQKATFKVIEDTALVQEQQNGVLITYEALVEAYRLSGQYMQDQAYPGKAIRLIEQALPYADHKAMTAQAVQMAIEKTKGVKVSAAAAPEADMLLNLEDHIHQRMINQTRAVNVVAAALRRGRAGVSNPKRPVGSFLFLGPTGVGKTELARSLAAVYFGDEKLMIRLDMSEYQRPEDVSRLLAAGGQNEQSLLLALREQPFSVILFDEIEKAHPNILNLFLQMLDEGQLTDTSGRPASFRSCIIIATSNAGAADITGRIKTGESLDNFERPLIDTLIASGQFKPELVNRFDEVVLFRPLSEQELALVAKVMLASVNKTLAPQQITVQLTDAALAHIVHLGYDPEFGARPMRRIIQKAVENTVAVKILRGEVQPGSNIILDIPDLTINN